jgi:riboflavin synthase alpha subunit
MGDRCHPEIVRAAVRVISLRKRELVTPLNDSDMVELERALAVLRGLDGADVLEHICIAAPVVSRALISRI